MSIRVGKYDYRTKIQPITEGYTNVLIHTTGPLSPYTMKDDNGFIMENYWQFSKIWERVERIDQPISQYQPQKTRWRHKAEIHVDEDFSITPKYWRWREKGFSHDRWVRYPNGHRLHREALGSVIGDAKDYEIVDYIEARKRIYYPKYREIAKSTKKFRELKKIYEEGGKLQINEVDGPTYCEEYPYNLTVDNSIKIDEEILRVLIDNPSQAFGHGYSLAACIMGIKSFE